MQVVLLLFLLFSLVLPVYGLLVSPAVESTGFRIATAIVLVLLTSRWIAWVRQRRGRYTDLGIEWIAIATLSVILGDAESTFFIVYVSFFFRPLVGSMRWAALGAVGSVFAVFTGAYFSGNDLHGATSLELLRQIPMFMAAGSAGLLLAHIVRQADELARNLGIAEQRYRSLVEQLPQVVFTAQPDGTITYISPQVEEMLGVPAEHFVGGSWQKARPLIHPEGREEVSRQVLESLRDGTPLEFDMRFEAPGRGTVWVRVSSHPVLDADDQLIYLHGMLTNITNEKHLERRLTYMAFHDDLTGLPNRSLFDDRLELAIARSERQGSGLAVLFLDLDNFKVVNDNLGHSFGDDLIQRVGERLQSVTRETDTVARLGGDEFMVLLEDVADEASAIGVAEKILVRLQPELSLHGERLRVDASIGVAWSAPPHPTPDDLIRFADLAMYVAKHEGKGRYAVYRPHMSEEALKQFRGGPVQCH